MVRSTFCSATLGVALSAGVAAVVCAPGSAYGVALADDEWQVHVSQGGSMNYGPFMEATPLSAREVELYADILGLDGDQRALAGELFGGLAVEHRKIATVNGERQADLRSGMDSGTDWNEVQKRTAEVQADFKEQTDALLAGFFADLRLVLTPEQESNWAKLEQMRRRRETLTEYAVYPKERLDLVSMVQGLDMPESFRERLKPLLQEYADSLDTVLVARNRQAEQLGEAMVAVNEFQADVWSGGGAVRTPEEGALFQERIEKLEEMKAGLVPRALAMRDACRRVRDVNEQYVRLLAERLPEKLEGDLRAQIGRIARTDEGGGMMDPMGGFSRAKMAIQTLQQIEMMGPMIEMQAKMFEDAIEESGQGDEMRRYLEVLKNIDPLTQAQKDEIAQIKADLESELEALDRRYGTAAPAASAAEREEPDRYTLNTPRGTVQLYKANVTEGRIGGQEEGEESEEQKKARERAEINQRAMNRLREILTIEQRSLISQL